MCDRFRGRLARKLDCLEVTQSGPNASAAPLTIRHVLSHVSGLREWRLVATFSGIAEGTYVLSNQDLLRIASKKAEQFPIEDDRAGETKNVDSQHSD